MLRGEVAFIDGEVLTKPGFGQNVNVESGKIFFQGGVEILNKCMIAIET